MLVLIARNLLRRPLRTGLTLGGIAAAIAVFLCMSALGEGYRQNLTRELNRAGVQMMLVPLGCPYDAAARVLKNNALETSLPESALEAARRDPAVAVAAPMLMAALPRENDRRTDLWVGLDPSALALKPWWHPRTGTNWFAAANDAILGADAALIEMRDVGDQLYSPETRRDFHVAGVLERSGTSDDSAFFVPLATAQKMFRQQGRLTAIAIRLKDPTLMREAASRLQQVPGAQVVTMAEMLGTFLNLLGAMRTLVVAVALVAVAVSAFSIFNTLLAAVIERTDELAVMRAVGASRWQVFGLLVGESMLLTITGALAGMVVALVARPAVDVLARDWVPLGSTASLVSLSSSVVWRCAGVAFAVGALSALYPAWRASQMSPALAAKP